MAFSIQPSSEIWDRHDFPILANWRRLWRMVEVGVDRGTFAHHFLSHWQGRDYFGIDSYEPYPEMPWNREADYQMAVTRLEQFGDRARLIRLASTEAAPLFYPGLADFIYIDGAHDFASVRSDLRAWWPALSKQGIMSGHDFDDTHPGVKQAVTEFAKELDLTVYLTSVEGYGQEECPSFYVYKSGIPGPEWKRC